MSNWTSRSESSLRDAIKNKERFDKVDPDLLERTSRLMFNEVAQHLQSQMRYSPPPEAGEAKDTLSERVLPDATALLADVEAPSSKDLRDGLKGKPIRKPKKRGRNQLKLDSNEGEALIDAEENQDALAAESQREHDPLQTSGETEFDREHTDESDPRQSERKFLPVGFLPAQSPIHAAPPTKKAANNQSNAQP